MNKGWIRFYRKIIDSIVFKDAQLFHLFCLCLLRAAHTEIWVSVKTGRAYTQVKLNAGQLVFGRHDFAKWTGQKSSSVRNRMQKLKKLQKVDIQPNTHYSIITILNWDTYQVDKNASGQPSGQPKDNQRTTNGQPKDTYNNNKELKELKNIKKKLNKKERIKKPEKKKYHDHVFLKDDEYKKLCDKYGKIETDSKIEDLDIWLSNKPSISNKKNRNDYKRLIGFLKKEATSGKNSRFNKVGGIKPQGNKYDDIR